MRSIQQILENIKQDKSSNRLELDCEKNTLELNINFI